MASPPASPPPPPPSPLSDASTSSSVVKRTRKASRLRSLCTRPPSAERLVVHVDPATCYRQGRWSPQEEIKNIFGDCGT